MPRRSLQVVRREGWRSFVRKAKRRLFSGRALTAAVPVKMVEQIGPLTLPEPHEPVASIVIPVFNNALYTFNCLLAVLRNTANLPYEVIVVDDASTDNTQAMLANVDNIRVQANPHNLGFVQTCNAGASAAAGKYIVFLNNDTQVHGGWLSSLVSAAESDPAIGLVGAKLLFPNGRLQEAGGVVWRDAEAWHYGRLDDPAKPEYNDMREVDYCSAACLLMRRDLFERIGGFDPRFSPAYYEDTDLAFAVRELGFRVIYQPQAVVTHFEGITAGTNTTSGMKRFQEVNRQKFRDKWRHVLDAQHPPLGPDAVEALERRSS